MEDEVEDVLPVGAGEERASAENLGKDAAGL